MTLFPVLRKLNPILNLSIEVDDKSHTAKYIFQKDDIAIKFNKQELIEFIQELLFIAYPKEGFPKAILLEVLPSNPEQKELQIFWDEDGIKIIGQITIIENFIKKRLV